MRPFGCTLLLAGLLALPPSAGAAAPPAKGDPPYRWMLPGEDARRADALEERVVDLWSAGRFAEARKAAQQVLALRAHAQGGGHWQTVLARYRLSALEKADGLKGDERAKFALVLAQQAVATFLYRRGHYAQAEALFRKALEARRAVLGGRHPETAESLNGVALCQQAGGRAGAAEPSYRQALATCRAALGERHPVTATVLNNLALCLKATGQVAQAEPLARKALAIRRAVLGGRHTDTAQSYNNLATCLTFQGQAAQAEPLLRQALKIHLDVLGPRHPLTATSYNNLAFCLKTLGQAGLAEPLFRKALAVHRATLGAEHPETALSLNNLAFCLRALDRPAQAEPLCREVLRISRKVLGEEHPDTASSYHNLAGCLLAQGKAAQAEPLFRKALKTCRAVLGRRHPDTAQTHDALASCLHALGKHARAEKEALRAAESYEAARLLVHFSGLDRAAFASSHSPLARLAVLQARNGKPDAAFASLERGLARALLDAHATRARLLSPAERATHQRRLDDLARIDRQLTALRGASSARARAQVEKLLQQRDRDMTALRQRQADLEKKHGAVAGEVYGRAAIQKHLPPGSALLAWADVDSEHWACLLRARGEPIWLRLPGSGPKEAWTAQDDALPARVRALLGRPPEARPWRKLAGQLYRQRMAPLAAHLKGVKHLVVLPSPALAGIPLEALLVGGGDRQPPQTVSYAPSGTFFTLLRRRAAAERRPRPPRLLALGDPAFARPADRAEIAPAVSRGPGFKELPGTRREVQALAGLFARSDVLLGARASEQQLEQLAGKGRLKEYSHLHLATHGLADGARPLRSFLALADRDLPDPLARVLAGQTAYTGRLTAEQILRSWRLDAELVVLSACQSGLGRYEQGEGYVGFAQALFLAGARSLVLSQWSVDDEATALLMVRFYQNLLGKRKGLTKSLGKAEALREAKAWLRNLSEKEAKVAAQSLPRGKVVKRKPAAKASKPYAHPYYWAGFILIGDPR
jgi:CHAT domain-containing protein/Tfp pilus assembly protein PilF